MVVLIMSRKNLKKFKNFSKMFERLEQQRVKTNLSIREIAKRSEVSRIALRKWELGLSLPNIVGIYQLAKFYNVSVDYLLGRTDNPEVNK